MIRNLLLIRVNDKIMLKYFIISLYYLIKVLVNNSCIKTNYVVKLLYKQLSALVNLMKMLNNLFFF